MTYAAAPLEATMTNRTRIASFFISMRSNLDAQSSGAPSIQVVLQDDCRRRGVDHFLSLSPVPLDGREAAFRFPAAQPFVFADHRDFRPALQGADEIHDPPGLLAGCPIQMRGQSNDYRCESVLVADPF